MRYLLDTHSLIWWLEHDRRLRPAAQAVIANPASTVYVSAASIWEVSIKRARGKLHFPEGLDRILAEERFHTLTITPEHAWLAGALPYHHDDPLDRMLIAQARAEGLILISRDSEMEKYGIRILEA